MWMGHSSLKRMQGYGLDPAQNHAVASRKALDHGITGSRMDGAKTDYIGGEAGGTGQRRSDGAGTVDGGERVVFNDGVGLSLG